MNNFSSTIEFQSLTFKITIIMVIRTQSLIVVVVKNSMYVVTDTFIIEIDETHKLLKEKRRTRTLALVGNI